MSYENRTCRWSSASGLQEQGISQPSKSHILPPQNGGDAACKPLKKYHGGIILLSNNAKYEPMVFPNKKIQNKPVKIIEKVVELRAKF